MIKRFRQLRDHQGFRKYFANTSWLFAEKILRMIVGLFIGVWIARYLGPEQFGLLSYAIAFVGLFTAIATLGLDGIVIRELVKNESRRDELIGTAFWLKLMGAFTVLVLLAIAISFTSNDAQTKALVFIIASATVFQSFNVVDFYFQSKVISKYVVYVNVASLFISSILKVVLILTKAPLIAFAWIIAFDSLVLACGYIYIYLKNTSVISNWRINRTTALDLLSHSWPLILSSVIISVYMKIDQVMIKEMLGNEAVGQYAAAVRLSEAWYFIPMVIASSLFPAIINAKEKNEELYYARLQKLYNVIVWIAITVAIPMTFLSDWLVQLLYGVQYDEAGSVLMIYIWAGVFFSLLTVSGRWLINENLTKIALYRNLIGLLINIILNYYLILEYGIVGSAIATLVSYAVSGYVYDLLDKRTRQTFKLKTNAILFLSIFERTR